MVSVIIIFSDPSALGYFFIGGIVLLEKGQNIFDNLFVTPFQLQEYLLSKTASLALLSLVTSTVIHLFTFGLAHLSLLFILGVLLTSAFFTLIGLGIAIRCRTLNEFFLISPLYTLIFTLPLFGYLHLYETPLYYLLPTKASLLLMEAPFQPPVTGQAIVFLMILIAWIVPAYFWAYRSFRNYVIE
ncbi:ABC transporter permease [Paenactinomyces guangxiensis]|uniref:ABC transporter permease n=1 Tax=Paenactinomyces guangxiensis TaxID=1490290 RepID=A0A7W2A9N6_9BACL|nr:ABC transporter permease [Paenactinomyces guangxiensis]MBA4495063.1 ABC transporter permease [Paenactinomyces guangxiensis]MBH8592253.1 ABC transporter permease [Paenactinomyces guangxiensis]